MATKEELARRREQRLEQARRKAAEHHADEQLVLSALRSILQDDRALPSEKIIAIYILDEMQFYHFIPDIPFPEDKSKDDVLARLREKFKDGLETSSATVTADA